MVDKATPIVTMHDALPLFGFAAAALIVAGGLPVYATTLLLGLIGWAAIGCAPDAYECPI
jgi:hypothetical protein